VLIDRIVRLRPGRAATAIKNVSFSDDLVTRYSTGASALPSSMLLEAMAQTAGVLVAASVGWARQPVLAKVQPFTAYGLATPGDQVVIDASLEDQKDAGCRAGVRATIDGAPVADATIYLALIGADGMDGASIARSTFAELFPGWIESATEPVL